MLNPTSRSTKTSITGSLARIQTTHLSSSISSSHTELLPNNKIRHRDVPSRTTSDPHNRASNRTIKFTKNLQTISSLTKTNLWLNIGRRSSRMTRQITVTILILALSRSHPGGHWSRIHRVWVLGKSLRVVGHLREKKLIAACWESSRRHLPLPILKRGGPEMIEKRVLEVPP